MKPLLYSAAGVVSSGCWFIEFKVLKLNVAILIRLSHLSKFDLSSVEDFFNTWARPPTSAEHTSCLPIWMAMQFGCTVLISHANLLLAVFSSIDATLIDEKH